MSCINRALRVPKCAATHCAHGDAMAEQLIVATGADSRWLGVTNEHILRGHGVSSCATCDGYLYRGRKIVVIGASVSANPRLR
jgi:thioredoxin reductase